MRGIHRSVLVSCNRGTVLGIFIFYEKAIEQNNLVASDLSCHDTHVTSLYSFELISWLPSHNNMIGFAPRLLNPVSVFTGCLMICFDTPANPGNTMGAAITSQQKCQDLRLLNQFPPLHYFPSFSELSNHGLNMYCDVTQRMNGLCIFITKPESPKAPGRLYIKKIIKYEKKKTMKRLVYFQGCNWSPMINSKTAIFGSTH